VAEHGFLQLCSDRRFHRAVMTAFEDVTGLAPEAYYIEARPGGAPVFADKTKSARLAYRDGAAHMGWMAHGDVCRGFYGESDDDLRRRLARTVEKRARDFPRAVHYAIFALDSEVVIERYRG
jgi:hypothetical protein